MALMKFYYVTNIFDLHTFNNETTGLLKLFEILTEMHFASLLFSKWKNYYNLTFDWTFQMYFCALC